MHRELLRISQLLTEAGAPKEGDDPRDLTQQVINKVSPVLDIPRLRSELVSLSKLFGIDSTLFTTREYWVTFVQHLLKTVADKPIRFPDGLPNKSHNFAKISDLFQELMDLPTIGNDFNKILSLEVILGDDNVFRVQLTSSSDTKFIFELIGIEPPEAFA